MTAKVCLEERQSALGPRSALEAIYEGPSLSFALEAKYGALVQSLWSRRKGILD